MPSHFPTGIVSVSTFGEDGGCGCPCGCAETITVAPELHTLPPNLIGLYTQEEWNSLVRRIDDVLKHTHWPAMPCMFTHFCIPFSPVCAMALCRSRRNKGITAVVIEENKRQIPRGLEWVQTSNSMNRTFLVLRWNAPTRQAWEAAHPGDRQVSLEPPALEFQIPVMAPGMMPGYPMAGPYIAQPGMQYAQPPPQGQVYPYQAAPQQQQMGGNGQPMYPAPPAGAGGAPGASSPVAGGAPSPSAPYQYQSGAEGAPGGMPVAPSYGAAPSPYGANGYAPPAPAAQVMSGGNSSVYGYGAVAQGPGVEMQSTAAPQLLKGRVCSSCKKPGSEDPATLFCYSCGGRLE